MLRGVRFGSTGFVRPTGFTGPGGPFFHKDPPSKKPEDPQPEDPQKVTGGDTPVPVNRYGGTGIAPGKVTLYDTLKQRFGSRPSSPGTQVGSLPSPDVPLGLPEAPESNQSLQLPEKVRKNLAEDAGLYIVTTATSYARACVDVGNVLHERAKSKKSGHWFLDLLVDVLVGSLLPSYATSFLNNALSTLISPKDSVEATKLGLAIIESKQTAALVGQVTSSVKTKAKGLYAEIAPESTPAEKFVQALGDRAMTYMRLLAGRVNDDDISDAQVVALCLAYGAITDAELRDSITKLALQFEAKIEPIGKRDIRNTVGAVQDLKTRTLARIQRVSGGVRLAMVDKFHSNGPGDTEIGEPRYRFEGWIAETEQGEEREKLEEMAYRKYSEEFGAGSLPPLLLSTKVWKRDTPDEHPWMAGSRGEQMFLEGPADET